MVPFWKVTTEWHCMILSWVAQTFTFQIVSHAVLNRISKIRWKWSYFHLEDVKLAASDTMNWKITNSALYAGLQFLENPHVEPWYFHMRPYIQVLQVCSKPVAVGICSVSWQGYVLDIHTVTLFGEHCRVIRSLCSGSSAFWKALSGFCFTCCRIGVHAQ